jgi:site-specific DNA-methyltransferase (adenine-specific)
MINLMLGDCLERMKEIKTDSVDMLFADLPFGTTACKWDSIINLALMWEQVERITKERGAILFNAQTPFDKVLGASNIAMLKYEWIWEKTSATGHLNAKKMPMKAHENILVFYKKPPTYNPQKTTGHKRKSSKTGKTYNSDCYGNESAKPDYDSTERYPRSVLVFKSDKQTCSLHPTQKPEALSDYMIKTYTNEGDVVCDITMGVGTYGKSAVKLGRSFIGIELDETYFNIAKDRIEKT